MDNYRLIYETLSGSHLYGTAVATSDLDYRGVAIEPIESLLGFSRFEQHLTNTPDRVIYSLRKFLQLAMDGNPNIVELLFAPVDGSTAVYTSDAWEHIRMYREYIISQKIRKTFVGYAYAQLKKMETHYRWLNTEPPIKPNSAHYGRRLDAQGNERWGEYVEYQRYMADSKLYEHYQTWLANRNDVRSALEQKYGYDTKFGMHLIRLLTSGHELLQTGKMTLPCKNAELLMEIRNGKYTYDELVEMATALFHAVDDVRSDLPVKPDYQRIENLVIGVHSAYLEGKI